MRTPSSAPHPVTLWSRISLIAAIIILTMSTTAASASNIIERHVPQAKIVGQGTLTYAFWDVYEATLYAKDGKWRADRPYALSIRYKMQLDGSAIAERSAQEIRRQGNIDAEQLQSWTAQMESIFPDVAKNTVLTAAYKPGTGTIFYKNNEKIGLIKGDAFAKSFFGIWLDERTSVPKLRQALLGL